jgi:hypothetical protein
MTRTKNLDETQEEWLSKSFLKETFPSPRVKLKAQAFLQLMN